MKKVLKNMGCIMSKKKNAVNVESVNRLKNIPLLNSLAETELLHIAEVLKEQVFEKDELLMKQGDPGETFFLIIDGKCAVEINDTGTVAELLAGDYCGEQALIYKCVRTASVRAVKRTTCLVLDKTTFKKVLGDSNIKFTKRDAKRTAVLCDLNDKPKKAYHRSSLVKEESVKQWLLKCVEKHILFEHLEQHDKLKIIHHMGKISFKKGDVVVKQGEQGDEFYVIEQGDCEVIVNDAKVARLSKDQCFGELALIYNSPRAATVRVISKTCEVWAVQRYVFRKAITDHFQEKDRQHVNLLKKMPIFKTFLNNEFLLISDACVECEYPAGTKLIAQGDIGDTFFMIISGAATYTKIHKDGKVEEGDIKTQYFGELALLHDTKRAASVFSKTFLRTLELNRKDFNTLLGPIEEHMKETAEVAYAPPSNSRYKSSEERHSPQREKASLCSLQQLRKIGVLGKGAFGFVTLVQNPITNKTFALKAIRKQMIVEHNQESIIVREKDIMMKMNHRTLVNLHRTYKDDYRVYFLLDACLGGELFTILRQKRYFTEKTARFYASCVVEGFAYMHSKNIIYRDLKPENLVLTDTGYLKITDFGFAKVVPDKTYTLCGTPDYLAPEIVTGQGHGKGVDWWTLGVFIYEMLGSVAPFYSSDPLVMYRSIVRGKYKTPKYFSDEVSDIVRRLLSRQATKRLGVINGGVSLVRKHPWFLTFAWDKLRNQSLPAPFTPNVQSRTDIQNFKQVKDTSAPLVRTILKSENLF